MIEAGFYRISHIYYEVIDKTHFDRWLVDEFLPDGRGQSYSMPEERLKNWHKHKVSKKEVKQWLIKKALKQ
jgi:hypothetical protein